jgi:hypothetical protein
MKMAVAKTVTAAAPAAPAITPPASATPATDCATEIQRLKAELAAKSAEVERLTVNLAKAENLASDLGTELVERGKKIEKLETDNQTLGMKFIEYEEKNAALKKALEEAKASEPEIAADGKNFFEVVAVPEEGVKPPEDLIRRGERCKKRVIDGFTHFLVPPDLAEELLTSTSGMKFYLVAPQEKAVFKRRIGLSTEDVEILPRVLDTHGSGKPYWKPLKVVESAG